MPIKAYHKLVRDRIPEIIEADGKTCVFETLSDEEYIYLLEQMHCRPAREARKNSYTFLWLPGQEQNATGHFPE